MSISSPQTHSDRKTLTHKFTHRNRFLQSLSATWQPPRECKSLIIRVSVTAEGEGSSPVVPAILFKELTGSAPFSRGHKIGTENRTCPRFLCFFREQQRDHGL